MDKTKLLLLNENGQSAVEYILMLVVVVGLSFSVIKSRAFQDFLGSESPFFTAMILRIEYSYRHGREGDSNNLGYTNHDTFYDPNGNKSRFFSAKEPYGN